MGYGVWGMGLNPGRGDMIIETVNNETRTLKGWHDSFYNHVTPAGVLPIPHTRFSTKRINSLLHSKHAQMGILKQLSEYLYIKKKDPNQPNTQWMKYMHGINRISIFMFLVALIVMIIKMIFFRHH